MNLNEDKKDRLYIFITISLIAHLLIFYLVPWGGLSGSLASDGSDQRDFEFIQVVDFQPIPEEPELVEDLEIEPEAEPEPEPEPEPEIENVEETEIEEETDIEQENETEMELESEPEPETEDETDIVSDEDREPSQDSETDIESDSEILTAEESDIEIEERAEEPEPEPEEQEREEPQEETEEVSEEEQEPSETSEPSVEESPPAPGELIQQSPLPVYPKDLVGGSETGRVLVEANVSEDGEVQSVLIIESSGIESMDRNAQSTVERGWSFRSYNRSYIMEIEVVFEVDERDNPVIDIDLLDLRFE